MISTLTYEVLRRTEPKKRGTSGMIRECLTWNMHESKDRRGPEWLIARRPIIALLQEVNPETWGQDTKHLYFLPNAASSAGRKVAIWTDGLCFRPLPPAKAPQLVKYGSWVQVGDVVLPDGALLRVVNIHKKRN